MYTNYEEAATDVDVTEVTQDGDNKVTTYNDTALDPLRQACKRRQWLATTPEPTTRGRKRAKLTSVLNEFMARSNKADLDAEDPLEWWVRHASDYPVLSKIAFDLSSECEHVFSRTEKATADERKCLSPDTVAATECQMHMLRTSMLS